MLCTATGGMLLIVGESSPQSAIHALSFWLRTEFFTCLFLRLCRCPSRYPSLLHLPLIVLLLLVWPIGVCNAQVDLTTAMCAIMPGTPGNRLQCISTKCGISCTEGVGGPPCGSSLSGSLPLCINGVITGGFGAIQTL